jgi:maltose/moltooligosaccharide transporter
MLAIQQRLSKSFYILLSLPATAMGFALSVQISALSWILTTQYGLDIHQVGLVWAAGPLAGILGQVIVGMISDNVWFWHGRRRPFMLIGGVLAALSLLALPNIDIVSSAMGIEQLLGIAILLALTLDLSINVSFNPTRAIIADVTPEGSARTKGYTWMQTISGSFGVLAYAIGAIYGNFVLIYVGAGLVLLLSVVPPLFITEPRHLVAADITPNSSQNKLYTVLLHIKPLWGFIIYDLYAMALQLLGLQVEHYWVELLLALVTLALVLQCLYAPEPNQAKRINHAGYQKVLAAHSFSWIGVQTMFVFIIAFLQDKLPNVSHDELGKIIATSFLILSAVSALLPALVLQPIAQKIGRIKTHTLCLASMAVGYLLVAQYGHQTYILYLLMALLGIGWSSIISLPFAIMSEKVEQDRMGLFMGLFNLSVVLPQLLVSLGIGLFISKVGDKSMVFYICSISLLMSTLAWTQVKESGYQARG